MRSLTLLAVTLGLIALVAAPALAQNVRTTAMGETSVGLADDSDALFYNPAGLPWVNTEGLDDYDGYDGYDGSWESAASVVGSVDADWDRFGISYAGHDADMRQGIGAGYDFWDFDGSETSTFGAGYGMQIGESAFAVGVAVLFETHEFDMTAEQTGVDDDLTFINLGLMYRNMDENMNEWRAGFLVNDIAEDSSPAPIYDLGASVRTPDGLILALDVNDVSDEIDTWVNVGAEYPIPETDAIVRAGLLDGDFTAGVGYRFDTWEVGVAYQDLDATEETSIGVAGVF